LATRIALATSWIDEPYTGVGVYTKELLDAMLLLAEREGAQFTLVHKGPSKDPVYLRAKNVEFSPLPGPLWLFSQERALKRVAADVDLVHEPYLGVHGQLPIPTVVTVHDTMPLDFPALVPRRFRAYFRRAMPKVLERCAAILVNSNRTKQDVMRHFDVPREKIFVTYLGVDHIRPPGPEAEEVLRSVGLLGKPYFLAVGTLPTKNLPYTLEGFRRYRRSAEGDPLLAVAGEIPKAVELEMFSDPGLAEGVLELGHLDRSKLPALYASAVALVHPSLYEGFGFPPLEAMRLGVPAIVSDRGALPEVAGDAALRADLDNPDSLVEAMARATDPTLRPSLVARGRARAAQFTWANTAGGTLMVYRGLVGSK
jgi:glycosyltransferase involved in cell wall biosynthesis